MGSLRRAGWEGPGYSSDGGGRQAGGSLPLRRVPRRWARALGQAVADELQELGGAEGLADGAGGAEGHAHAEIVEAIFRIGQDSAGHADDRQAGGDAADGADGLEAVLVRHEDVADDEIERHFREFAQALVAVAGRDDLEAGIGERLLDELAEQLIVVDHENAGHGLECAPFLPGWAGTVAQDRPLLRPRDSHHRRRGSGSPYQMEATAFTTIGIGRT